MTEPATRAVGPAPEIGDAGRVASEAGVVLGVDLGGTKMRAALADLRGAILAEVVEPTVHGPAERIVAQVAAAHVALAERAGAAPGAVVAAGLGLPLAVDPRTGESWSFHNVPGLGGVAAQAAFRHALGMPLALENDANCAAIGEGRAGAAVGLADYAVIAIGTGIGSGIVAGGRLLRGVHGGAGEIAFLPLGSDPWDVRNRALGAYETAAAGPAVRRRLAALLDAGAATTLAAGSGLADIVRAAEAGDALAQELLDDEARFIALGIAAVAAVTDPELVVLSGGVGAIPALLEPVREHVATLCARPPHIVTGLLGERAPLVGAIGLALDLAPST